MSFAHIATLSGFGEAWLSGVTDLELRLEQGGLVCYAVSRPGGGADNGGLDGGGLASFRLDPGRLTPLDEIEMPGLAVTGLAPRLAPQTDAMLITGVTRFGVWSVGLGPGQGDLRQTAEAGPSPADWPEDLCAATLLRHGGTEYLYAARLGSDLPAVWRFDPGGPVPLSAGGGGAAAHGIAAPSLTALDTLRIAGQDLLLGVGRGDAGLISWRIDADGLPREAARLGPQDGLWVADPAALATVSLDGRSYAVIAAQTSGTLSVVAVEAGGALRVTDHLIDDRGTRFGGAHLVETATIGDAAYVLAGGTDQGLSLFRLLPGGRLLHLEAIADRPETNLTGLLALQMIAQDGRLEIVTASQSEPGLAWHRVDPGPPGLSLIDGGWDTTLTGGSGADLLSGGAGDDRLIGGAGADILVDGAGADRLTGGAGADIFVFEMDGAPDRITDFDPAEDRIDLSGWRFLRSPGQLGFISLADGGEIRFEDEVLRLFSSDGRAFGLGELAALPLLGVTRLLPEWTLPLPVLAAGSTLQGGSGDDRLAGGAGEDLLRGLAGDDLLQGGGAADRLFGGAGADLQQGGSGDDLLRGGGGWDRLEGQDGADRLFGEDGHDLLFGGLGDDLLDGNAGADRLWGGAGDDALRGGLAGDRLFGGAGADRLEGAAGADLLRGGAGDDQLWGNAGRDVLLGDAGTDRLYGGINHDRLEGGGGHDLLRGESGNDRLWGGPGNDWLEGGGGADVFVFSAGRDRISDFRDGVDRLLLDPALWGGGRRSGNALLAEFGSMHGDDLLLRFDHGARLLVEDVGRLQALLGDIGMA